MDIKTIDINALEWFDKVNGNSYFSATITLNYGMEEKREYYNPKDYNITQDKEVNIKMSFQYGYGEQYIDSAFQELIKQDYVNIKRHDNGSYGSCWRYCEENNIILRTNKQKNCLKRQLTK